MRTRSIMVVGVGGQGSVLASKILGRLLVGWGYDVKVSEVHGMSQRGGSVLTNVRWGTRVASPVVGRGGADLIVSFELLEAARWLDYLRPGGRVIVSAQEIAPMPVLTGAMSYPEGLLERMRATGAAVDAVDGLALAGKAGSPRAVNLVLMGHLSRYLDLPEEAWQEAIKACVPGKFLELNQRAFELGRNS